MGKTPDRNLPFGGARKMERPQAMFVQRACDYYVFASKLWKHNFHFRFLRLVRCSGLMLEREVRFFSPFLPLRRRRESLIFVLKLL